ncbi:MAG: pyridoxamine 5'-phosphate oxidase family protein [Alphaproteobacteria bacterium]
MPDAVAEPNRIASLEALEAIYGTPMPRAVTKEIDYISDHYRAFIEASPFVTLSTVGPEGTDCSPRGDPAGFCRVVDRKTVLMPDRRGNNRIDSLRNIVRDPRVSLLFLVPTVGETLRINGRAELRTDPDLLAAFEMEGKLPRSVIKITAERVYFQCTKALVRSKLWDPEAWPTSRPTPTAGQILKGIEASFDAETYDAGYPEHMKNTIY